MTQNKLASIVAAGTSATTVVISAILNTWAFTRTGSSYLGYAVGVLLPCWVLALTFVGHVVWPTNRRLAAGAYALAAFALVVSMPHLAAGYGSLGLSWLEMWCLAIVTDLCQIACKLTIITLAQTASRRRAARKPASKPALTRQHNRLNGQPAATV
jgi:hypothetical protein